MSRRGGRGRREAATQGDGSLATLPARGNGNVRGIIRCLTAGLLVLIILNIAHPDSRSLMGVPELPPWRVEGHEAEWHVGITTSQMLEDLVKARKSAVPHQLAAVILDKLDAGNFTVDDLATACALALGDEPLYWRVLPAKTVTLDGKRELYFNPPETIRDGLYASVGELIVKWLYYESEDMDIERLMRKFQASGQFLFEFLQIHPFFDGNGRCSRALAGWMLWRDIGFMVKLPEPDKQTRNTMAEMSVARYLMIWTRQEGDPALFTAFLIDCAWSQH